MKKGETKEGENYLRTGEFNKVLNNVRIRLDTALC